MSRMSILDLPAPMRAEMIDDANELLKSSSPEARIEWALGLLPGSHILSSSFGIQSAVMLHLMSQQKPNIPVILVDTGYLFPETYRFIDELVERLGLNLHTYRADISPAWQETKYGLLWEQGKEGLEKFNMINKVDPMSRALDELKVKTWFSGLRRSQSQSRAERQIVEEKDGRIRVHPIVDWSNRDIHSYLKSHDLPYHPLWEEGYVSVGDVPTTRKADAGMAEEDTRFFGLFRECGLHS